MSSSLYEIVELKDGTLSLKQADSEGEPLVNIKFSDEAVRFMADSKLEVVKAMIEAGFQAVSDITEREMELDSDSSESNILH